MNKLCMNTISNRKILVVGDVMLDTYYLGSVSRISPEAPVPVFHKTGERHSLGGAANVAQNLVAANQCVSVMSIVGNDNNGHIICEMLEQIGVNTSLIFKLDRTTTEKTRLLASNNQQVIRLDIENTDEISDEICNLMIRDFSNCIKEFDLILISDYLKGLLTFDLSQKIINIANEEHIKVIIDVKDTHTEKYQNAYLLKPNKSELHSLTGMSVDSDEDIVRAASYLQKQCMCKYVLATCGARGMILVGDEKPYFIDAVARDVFDVTGAGDTTVAYLATCIANDFLIKDAVAISNIAAGIQVSKVGTSSVYWDEIKKIIDCEGQTIKLLSNESVEYFREEHANKKIVFTNGCFDILHVGHIKYLKEASKLGDILIVGLNSDASVKRLKGDTRPINNEFDRAELLCSLECIDYVVIFDDTPYRLIEKIKPDILVKGGDYKPEDVVGKDIVESRGGKLVLLPYIEGKSTTAIIKKIKE